MFLELTPDQQRIVDLNLLAYQGIHAHHHASDWAATGLVLRTEVSGAAGRAWPSNSDERREG